MTRIIAGFARARRLKVPKGRGTRPTADRVREAMFSALQHRFDLDDARVLDLFAGAGTLGLEALSRGAASVVLVEADRRACDILRENAATVGGDARVVCRRVEAFLQTPPAEPYHLVLLDPPYAAGALEPTLTALLRPGWLAPDAVVCLERPAAAAFEAPPGLDILFDRAYGAAAVTVLEKTMRTALYPGSFDPITCGHVDIVRRGLDIFDTVIVAVAVNIKKQPFFPDEERVALIEEVFADEPRVKAVTFQGLLVDYARQSGIQAVLRGLRAVSDFEYEFQMASMNRRLTDEVDYVFMMTSEEHFYVSSSLVREVALNRGDVSQFVPDCVLRAFQRRFSTPAPV